MGIEKGGGGRERETEREKCIHPTTCVIPLANIAIDRCVPFAAQSSHIAFFHAGVVIIIITNNRNKLREKSQTACP